MTIDSIIHQVTMHPEIWFCDVLVGTNRQKRDLFVMAIRNPTGKTFPGNLTVIPCGQRWVFVSLSTLAFNFLYGSIKCSRNRMSIHDEDYCQYGAFENAISTSPDMKKSTTYLCVFHGVWQFFAKMVFKHLPRKSENSNELSNTGKQWGENTCHIL